MISRSKPRRARSRARSDYRLHLWVPPAIIVALIAITLIGLGMSGPEPKATPEPQPGPTWTTYVPQTSQVCHDLAEAAGKVSDQATLYGESSWKAVERLRTAKTLADVAAARKENEKAKRAAKGLDRSQPALVELVKKCRNS